MDTSKLIILGIFVMSGIFYYCLTDATANIETYQVSQITDGDTIKLTDGQVVRLLGINTPESSMPFNKEATEFLEKLIQNESIQVESHGIGKYGRTLAYIFLDNKNINKEILLQGFATLYYYEKDNHYAELKRAEEFARMNQKGLWKKSSNENCLGLIELKIDEPEKLVLENKCNKEIEIAFKDDATHIYRATLKPNSIFTKEFSHIWNNNGDSIYIRDTEGLLIFYRY